MGEEHDRITDRLAVLVAFGDASEEVRAQHAQVLADLRARVKTLEAEHDAVRASRDVLQEENRELIAQCRTYRNQLQKCAKSA